MCAGGVMFQTKCGDAFAVGAMIMASISIGTPVAQAQEAVPQCRVITDVRTGPMVGCWNSIDTDQSLAAVPGLYSAAVTFPYQHAADACRARPEIRRSYCDFSALEITIDRFLAARARDRNLYYPRLSAMRYLNDSGRMREVIAREAVAFLDESEGTRGSYMEREVCGGRTTRISNMLDTAIKLADEMHRQEMADRQRNNGNHAVGVLLPPDGEYLVALMRRYGQGQSSPYGNADGSSFYFHSDLADVYQFTLDVMNSTNPDAAAAARYPVIRRDDVRSLCARLHNMARASQNEARDKLRRRVADRRARGREFEQFLDVLADDRGASGNAGFLAVSKTVGIGGLGASSDATSPVMTAAHRTADECRAYRETDPSIGTLPASATGQEWLTRYRDSRRVFASIWASCMRRELCNHGGCPTAASDPAAASEPAEGATAAEAESD